MNAPNFISKLQNNQSPAMEVEKLMQRLPKDLDETAKSYGAIVRRRKINSGVGLFLAIAIYVVMELSQRVLAATFSGTKNVSDQAWQKKIVRCEPWLSHLLSEIIPKLAKKEMSSYTKRSVKLIDASIFQQAGYKNGRGGKTLRLHLCYNLTDGRMESATLTDNTVAEAVSHFPVERDALYIADAGYGKGTQYLHIKERQADALFRVTPNHLKLAEDDKGSAKIDMSKKLDASAKLLDFKCFVHTHNGKYAPVRIIASRLPEDKALLAKKRKLRKSSKRQSQIRKETLVYAEWVILMTSLDDDYTAEELLKMYRNRWQIELLFKRIKQLLKVTKLRPASLEHSKVTVLTMLILWAITEKQVLAAELLLLEKGADMSLYCIWTTCSFCFQKLKAGLCLIFACLCDTLDFQALERLFCHRSLRTLLLNDLRFG